MSAWIYKVGLTNDVDRVDFEPPVVHEPEELDVNHDLPIAGEREGEREGKREGKRKREREGEIN